MNLNTANLMVGKAASTDPLRENLNSIHVTDSYTEATNGHILARVSLPYQFPLEDIPAGIIKTEDAEYLEPFLIPAKPALAIKTFRKKSVCFPCLVDSLFIDVEKTNVNGTAIFSASDRESTINPVLSKIKMEFPDVERVIPRFDGEEDQVFHTAVNISYLETLLAIAKSTGSEFVTIDGVRGKTRPVLLKAEHDGQKFTGIIMPVKG